MTIFKQPLVIREDVARDLLKELRAMAERLEWTACNATDSITLEGPRLYQGDPDELVEKLSREKEGDVGIVVSARAAMEELGLGEAEENAGAARRFLLDLANRIELATVNDGVMV